MHHYSQKTCHSNLGSGTQIQYLWSEHIPAEARKHAFLMHGVLALAALHIASCDPSQADKYASLCDRHQAQALSAYRTILTNVTDEACNALFALSTVLSVSSLARASLRASLMPEPQRITIGDMTELMSMTRGVREVVHATHHVIRRGPFSVLLSGHDLPRSVQVILGHTLDNVFFELTRMVREEVTDREHSTLYLQSVDSLRRTYETVIYHFTNDSLQMGHIWAWVAAENDYAFIKLVQNRCAPALVIVAHFFVLTMLMRDAWYISNLGRFAIEGILDALDGQLAPYLVWVRVQLATDLANIRAEDAATFDENDAGANSHSIDGLMSPLAA